MLYPDGLGMQYANNAVAVAAAGRGHGVLAPGRGAARALLQLGIMLLLLLFPLLHACPHAFVPDATNKRFVSKLRAVAAALP